MRVDGACHCGAIHYTAKIDPEKVIICHCTDCQTISGAPYRVNVAVLTENLDLSGEPRLYLKTGDSGRRVATAFCGTCGSGVYSHPERETRFKFLRTGAIRQRASLPPRAQGFCHSALAWSHDLSGIPQVGAR